MLFTNSGAISARTSRFIEATLDADAASVRDRLARQRIEIVLDPLIAHTFTGQMIAFTLVNLLIRLDAYCPPLEIALPDVRRHPLLRLLPGGSFAEGVDWFFAPFPAAERLTTRPSGRARSAAHIRVRVSPHPSDGTLSVWADGWIVYLNQLAPADYGNPNAIGANVAAGLAAAEIFKRLIGDIPLRPGMHVRPVDQLIFSTYDYGLVAGPNPPLPAAIDLEGVVIVGLGGIGSAFVGAASSLPGIDGRPIFVDQDVLDTTNLNRHLVSRPGDSGPKVAICRRALAFHAEVDERVERFEEFVAQRGDRHDLVVVGVDDDRVRRAIQASRPRMILNAGTSQTGSFQVTRHDYLQGACLACIAHDDLREHPAEREVARRLGLDLQEILRFQASGAPVPTEVLQRAGVLSDPDIAHLSGRPIAEIQRHVCAEIPMGAFEQEEAVSISFLSALPGFLLLGEVIKERSWLHAMRPPLNHEANHTLLSVLGRPHPLLLRGWREKGTGCDCTRAPYQRAHRRKWTDVNEARA